MSETNVGERLQAGADGALGLTNAYLQALHETSLGLMKRLDLDELLQAIVRRAATLADTEHGWVYLVEPGTDELEVKVGIGDFASYVGFRMRRGEGLAGKVWENGETIRLEDYEGWMGRSPNMERGVVRACVGVPLVSGGEVAGVIGLAHVEPGPVFGDEQVETLTRFAQLASIALDNARLYRAAQQELADRRRTEVALRVSEGRYQRLFESAPTPMWVTDVATQRFLAVNDAAVARYGYSREEFLGMGLLDVRPADDVPALRQVLADPMLREARRRGRHRAKDGTIFDVDVAWQVVEFGGRTARLALITDVTDRLRVEEDRRRAGDEPAHALDQEREAARRLRALDEMKNTFLSAVSHELRTPLTSVLGFALTLEREPNGDAERRAEVLGRLASNARKLERLLADLLDLDRLAHGSVELRRRPADLAALARRVLEQVELPPDRTVHLDAHQVTVPVDAAKIERVVENLVVNAVRYAPDNSPIWVRVRPEPGGAVVIVEDAGPGIPQELRESILEPFVQGPAVQPHSPGVGIGLSLVARFTALHGGTVTVGERDGGGASIRVFLPAEPEG